MKSNFQTYTLKNKGRGVFILERTVSQEERIRRAEEIYNRRRTNIKNGVRVSSNSVNNTKTKLSLFKKMGLQLAICSVIYIIFYLIKNTNYIFSEDVISKTREMLSYDINFGNVYSQISSFIEDNKDKFTIPGIVQDGEVNETSEDEKIPQTNEQNEQKDKKEEETNTENNQENNIKEGGIGGAEVNEIKDDVSKENEKKTQMELDAEYVKKQCSFKVPLKGSITSRYGAREANEIVSANHYGIDIGANKGTAIFAATDGTVTLVSSEGDYRKTSRNYKRRGYDKICTLQ